MSETVASSPLPIVASTAALRALIAPWRAAGQTVGLVPTMGALHPGHISLITLAKAHADRVVASVFVNPTQFGPNEDFSRYPRDPAGDARLLAAGGCDALYLPDAAGMYPPGFATTVTVTGLTDGLCGAWRPGHFAGVATVVAKLLIQAGADCAVFGEKDFQQLQVIRRLTADLDIPTRILGAPTLRDPDGLAMSSRNRYLSAAQRAVALALPRSLQAVAAAVRAGGDPATAAEDGRAALLAAGFDSVDYLAVVAEATMAPPTGLDDGPLRVVAAARLGGTRLIDNLPV